MQVSLSNSCQGCPDLTLDFCQILEDLCLPSQVKLLVFQLGICLTIEFRFESTIGPAAQSLPQGALLVLKGVLASLSGHIESFV